MASNPGAIIPSTTIPVGMPDLSMMQPQERDALFFQMIAATAIETQKVKNQMKNIADELNTSNKRGQHLERIVSQQQKELSDWRAYANREQLNKINSSIKKTCFPEKDLIWKQRVLAKLLQNNPSAHLHEIELAYSINRETRQELRKYICIKGQGNCFFAHSSQGATLIAYAKLLLRDNPLYEWKALSSLLDRAWKTIQCQPGNFEVTEYMTEIIADMYEDVLQKVVHYYELPDPEKAAQLLFENPDIAATHLWIERRMRASDYYYEPSFDD